MIITLDGPSATGKSTLAKALAKKLGYKFLNSGMIYRAVTYYLLKNSINFDSDAQIPNAINKMVIQLVFIGEEQSVLINGTNCSQFVSTKEVQENVSLYSQNLDIRHKVLQVQRQFAAKHNIVIEGRDIGTEVFPMAEFKFYVECSIDVRAKRRHADLTAAGQIISLDEVKKSLEKRDYIDSTRKFSPLTKPKDAIVIDTTLNTIDQSLNFILNYVKRR